jgi:SAM-dependent methyltransferase
MGCFYCCRKQVFDDLGGYDENILRGQTVDFGLRARLKGWFCLAVPHIEFIHAHTLRLDRPNLADSNVGHERTIRAFRDKWGFDRIAPDLDVVASRYAGTPLLWNKLVFADEANAAPDEPFAVENSDWVRYTQDEPFQQGVNMRLTAVADFIKQTKVPDCMVLLGAGHGLLAHLLAKQGIDCVGFDDRGPCVELARSFTAGQTYPTAAPRYEHFDDPGRIAFGDGQAQMVVIDGYLERHRNPVALLGEAWRILAPGHLLLIISRRKVATGQLGAACGGPSLPMAGIARAGQRRGRVATYGGDHQRRSVARHGRGCATRGQG